MGCDGDCWLTLASAGSLAVAGNLPQFSAKMASPPTKSPPEKLLHHAIMFVWMLCKTNKSSLGMNGLFLRLMTHFGLFRWVGSGAKSASNLSKNGLATNQIMIRKASTSCNHVCICMDAMQDKQKFIGDEWAVLVIDASL